GRGSTRQSGGAGGGIVILAESDTESEHSKPIIGRQEPEGASERPTSEHLPDIGTSRVKQMAEISKTAEQALAVLLELGEHGPMTPAELSRSLEMNRTVVHRLLATLRGRGFVVRLEKGYVAGPVLLRIAESVQPELRARARAILA